MSKSGYAEVIGGASGSGGFGVAWFGDGSDGDFVVANGTTHSEPVALDSGVIIKQYKNLTIEYNAVWQPANRCNMTKILVSGDLTLDGTMTFNKLAPLMNDAEAEVLKDEHWNLCNANTQLKGGNGGNAGAGYAKVNYGQNIGGAGAGGAGHELGGGNGGGSGGIGAKEADTQYNPAKAYNGGSGDPRPPIGTVIPYPPASVSDSKYGTGGGVSSTKGGAGPGGSGGLDIQSQSNGGGPSKVGNDGDALGGGCVIIFVKGKVRIGASGVLSADGGSGANGAMVSTNYKVASGGGGGGGGGIIVIIHSGDFVNSGSVHANGGPGGAAGSTSFGYAGNNGESGTVLISALSKLSAAS